MLSQDQAAIIIGALLLLGLVVILTPWLLSRRYKAVERSSSAPPSAGEVAPAPSFFQIPYITWFLIHYGVAALSILAIIILALDGVIDKSTVAALLGGLFGYVLGSTGASRPAAAGADPKPAPTTTHPPMAPAQTAQEPGAVAPLGQSAEQ